MKQFDFDLLRREMVQFQIRNRGIHDHRVIAALLKVPRHEFVPRDRQEFSYHDGPLPIGEGQTISQPYIVALMSQTLRLLPNEKVLEIGTGSGYQTAILAELCQEVFSIEIRANHAQHAIETLKKMNYNNVHVRHGDGHLGWQEFAPYDAIIVTCAPEDIPPLLIEQLAENGRLIIPVGAKGEQQLLLLKKENGEIKRENLLQVIFVPMTK